MAVLVRYQPSSLDKEMYGKVNEAMQARGDEGPPGPLRIHVLFGEEPNLNVSEIWESEDEWRKWYDGALKQGFSDAGLEMPEPQVIEVHALWGSGLQPT